jgi:hypothetical protein
VVATIDQNSSQDRADIARSTSNENPHLVSLNLGMWRSTGVGLSPQLAARRSGELGYTVGDRSRAHRFGK